MLLFRKEHTFIQNRNSSKRSGFILIAPILLCALLPVSRACGQGVMVTPSRVFFNLPAGQLATERIQVTNTDSNMLVLNATLKDWYRDSLGTKIYSDAGSLPVSNASWVRIDPVQLVLQPGETKEVSVSMQVPGNPRPVTNSMLFLTQVNERKPVRGVDKSGNKVAIIIKVEVGIHLYNTIPGIGKKNLEFTAFEDKGRNSDSTRLLAIAIQNKGDVATDGQLRVELTNKTSGATVTIRPKAISMLPGAMQMVYVTIPAHLQKGNYQAAAILDSGPATDLKVAQKDIVYE